MALKFFRFGLEGSDFICHPIVFHETTLNEKLGLHIVLDLESDIRDCRIQNDVQ